MSGCSGKNTDAGNREATVIPTTDAATAEATEEATPQVTEEAVAEATPRETEETAEEKTPTATKQIGFAKAKKIALKEAGLSAKNGSWEKQELDREDGRMIYELEFVSGEREYEFEIDAQTGAVIDFKEESVYD